MRPELDYGGKTAAEEERDSVQMLGTWLVIGALAALVALGVLITPQGQEIEDSIAAIEGPDAGG